MWTKRFVQLSQVALMSLIILLIALSSCGSNDDSNPTAIVPTANQLPYNIQVRFVDSGFTPQQQTLFQSAANRWSQIISQDVPDIPLNLSAGSCLDVSPAINQVVDDLRIDVSGVEIDGEGGVLGSAAPCQLREQTLIPIYGGVQFDRADVAQLEATGLLETVILHEMGHTLGLGTIWVEKELVEGIISLSPQYVGASGIAQYEALGGSGTVPVENRGTPGTRSDHWRESTFASELMTGFVDEGNNPLSRITVGALVDLGYQVNLAAADPYDLPTSLPTGVQFELRETTLSAPLEVVNRFGERLFEIIRP